MSRLACLLLLAVVCFMGPQTVESYKTQEMYPPTPQRIPSDGMEQPNADNGYTPSDFNVPTPQPALVESKQQLATSETPLVLSSPAPTSIIVPPEPTLSSGAEETNEADNVLDPSDPDVVKTNAALDAAKQEIVSLSRQIKQEDGWVTAINKIETEYRTKISKVEKHVEDLKTKMKELYLKKKSLENLLLQKALEAKLKEAQDELANLQATLAIITSKDEKLRQDKERLQKTISDIQKQLDKLKGIEPSTESSTGAEGADFF